MVNDSGLLSLYECQHRHRESRLSEWAIDIPSSSWTMSNRKIISTTRSAIGAPKAPRVPNLANLVCQTLTLSTGPGCQNTYRKPPAIGPQSIPHVNAVDPQAIYDPKFSGRAVSAIILKPSTPTTAPDRPWQARATRSSQGVCTVMKRIVARAIAMKPQMSGALRARYLSHR